MKRTAKSSAPPTAASRQLERLSRDLQRQAKRSGLGKRGIPVVILWTTADGRDHPIAILGGTGAQRKAIEAQYPAVETPRVPPHQRSSTPGSAPPPTASPAPISRADVVPIADANAGFRNRARCRPAPYFGPPPPYRPEQRLMVAELEPVPNGYTWRRPAPAALTKFSPFARARRG